jgi:hypothetical protein
MTIAFFLERGGDPGDVTSDASGNGSTRSALRFFPVADSAETTQLTL